MKSVFKTLLKRLRRIAVCMFTIGVLCSVCQAKVFSPRSGEIFQTTREGPGPATWYPFYFGALCPPLGIVLIPVALCMAIADECVVSPVVDLVCLPYDLLCPRHGYVVRFVDEEGIPVSGVTFTATSHYGCDAMSSDISDVSDEAGEINISRLAKNHYINRVCATKEGYYDFSPYLKPGYGDVFTFRPSRAMPGEDGRIVCQLLIRKKGKIVPMAHSQINIPDAVSRFKSEDLLYDCEIGSWLPPYGKGEEADLKVSYKISPEPKAGERAPWFVDTRIEISAVRPEDGFLVRDVFLNCNMLSDRVAPVDGAYVQSPDNPALVWDHGKNRRVVFPDSKYCIFRLRTRRAADGSIESAHYGKLLFITGSGCLANCYYVREPNETSLEQEGAK